MTNQPSLGRVANAALLAAGLTIAGLVPSAMAQQNQPANNGIPAPKIVVIDRNAIWRSTKAGASIQQQGAALMQQLQNDFKTQGDSLRKEGTTLQQQVAIYAPDVRQKKLKDFQAKQIAFQKRVQQRQYQIEYGVLLARAQIEKALGPILQGILKEKGANLLVDRAAVIYSSIDIDITPVSIQRLDQKLPNIKVAPQDPPPDVLAQMQRQQQQ
jgi:Skp family chaperone for outer membrane proteins